jgi:hypothetical protein
MMRKALKWGNGFESNQRVPPRHVDAALSTGPAVGILNNAPDGRPGGQRAQGSRPLENLEVLPLNEDQLLALKGALAILIEEPAVQLRPRELAHYVTLHRKLSRLAALPQDYVFRGGAAVAARDFSQVIKEPVADDRALAS